MAKFKLQPEPTFKRKVSIPVPGDKPADVEFTFKFRSRDQLQELVKDFAERQRVDVVMDMAVGWDLSDDFTAENLGLMDQRFIGSLERVVEAYWDEHTKAIEKN